MRKGEFNWFWTVLIVTPLLMVYTKSARMDAKEIHEIQMRVKHRSEFWEKGNHFTDELRQTIHKQLTETQDPEWGK